MQVINWDKNGPKKIGRESGVTFDKNLTKKVNKILTEVQERGDVAVRRFTKDFDGIEIPLKKLKVSEGEINQAFEKISVKFVPFIKKILKQIDVWGMRYSTRKSLAKLSSEQLQDIGLTEGERQKEVNLPFWK